MTFSSKVDHFLDIILSEDSLYSLLVPDVNLLESVVRTVVDERVKVVEVSCIGHAINVHNVI